MRKSLGMKLVQQQVQKVIMNQEMRQAITILQCSTMELLDYVHKLIEENPMFDVELNRGYPKNHLPHASSVSVIDYYHRREKSLEAHLMEQLGFQPLSPRLKRIGRYLIGLIDHQGYFREELGRVAAELNCSVDEVEQILGLIQTFDPPGIGARNLQESLVIQLKHKGIQNPHLEAMIHNHLNDLAEKRWDHISAKLGIGLDETKKLANLVRGLNPRPGANFISGDVRYIIPDVYVQLADGEPVVSLNDYVLPRLSINPSYLSMIKEVKQDSSTHSFLRDHLRNAIWTIRTIEQRYETIVKVTKAIFRYQKDFLVKGVYGLVPLSLVDIAGEVGVHPSTVSRTVNQKYVQTEKGVYELKYFFVNGLVTKEGESLSPYLVKREIEMLIQAEKKEHPLSDQQITDELNAKGIKIARRTVMKYREELGIPSSSMRRRLL